MAKRYSVTREASAETVWSLLTDSFERFADGLKGAAERPARSATDPSGANGAADQRGVAR